MEEEDEDTGAMHKARNSDGCSSFIDSHDEDADAP